MNQLSLFTDITQQKHNIVNVASVPQRSPFRYPGGKTWLVPRLREWLGSHARTFSLFIEPFVGGGIISLTVAFEKYAEQVLMVERDEQIAAVWKTILSEKNEWLCEKILTFELTSENVHIELEKKDVTLEERAFQTILRNRVNHGGILAPGSGLLKYGENGKGLRSRWYPATLAKRIRDIARVRDRIVFIEGDGLDVMRRYAEYADAVFFIDPPYTAAGKRAGARLYTYNELNHEELFCITESLSGDFLMTYDNAGGIIELASRHGFEYEPIAMRNTHHAEMTELLIGRNLTWARTISSSLS